MLKLFENLLNNLSIKVVSQGRSDTGYLFMTQLILISIGISIVFNSFFLVNGAYEIVGVSCVFYSVFLYAIFLIRKNRFKQGKIYFVLALNLNLLAGCLLGNSSIGIFYFFFPVAAGSLIVFESHERKLKKLFAVLPIAFFLFIQLVQDKFSLGIKFNNSTLALIYQFSCVTSITLTVYIVSHFINQIYYKTRKLNEEKANLVSVINSCPELVWNIDKNYLIQNFNASLSSFIEQEFNVKINRGIHSNKFFNLFDKNESIAERWHNHYTQALNGKSIKTEEQIIINNKKFIFELHINPILLKNSINGAFIHAKNVTIQKEQEQLLKDSLEENKLLAKVASYTKYGVVILNSEFKTLWANDGFELITGFKFDQIQNINPLNKISGPLTTKVDIKKINKLIKTKQTFEYEFIIYRNNGEPLWSNINITPLFDDDNEISRYIVIGMDINERKQSEQQLQVLLKHTQKLNTQLQKRDSELQNSIVDLNKQSLELQISQDNLKKQKLYLEILNNELSQKASLLENKNNDIYTKNQELERARLILAQKAEQLEQSSRYKSEFLANMSHELRTPLNSILILSRLLSENKENNLTPKQIEFSRVVNKSGSDLLNLINDILDLSKIEAGKIELEKEEHTINEICSDIETMFTQVAQEQNINFLVQKFTKENQKIYTDHLRLSQILKNLLSNAFKFTKASGTVTLSVRCLPDNIIEFKVKDNGIGIPSDKHLEIFNSFQQVDGSISRKYGGTGLGLSISRELALLLGGTISLDSEPEKGSIFSIQVPSGIEETCVQENTIEFNSKLLLILEDDEIFAQLLEKTAYEHGYRVEVCHRGDVGFMRAKEIKPDCILLDMNMPGMNGVSVLKNIQNTPEIANTPVYVISAWKANSMKEKIRIKSWVEKPVSETDLNLVFENISKLNANNLCHVLVIEDSFEQSIIIRQLLTKQGINCTIAHTGEMALNEVRNQTFDCIILDLNLPDSDGINILKEIKEEEHSTQLPVIVYSSRELSDMDKSILCEYTSSYIKKNPKEFDTLMEETNVFLKSVMENRNRKLSLNIPIQDSTNLIGKKILVVDDDQRNIYALCSMLEGFNLNIICANNGNEAIKMLDSNGDIDMILMDIMMPEMNGYEATKQIRSRAKYKDLPIVALTAKAMIGDREICMKAGMNDYITKPIDSNNLISIINNFFE
jgi:PAS domain S-box-containing protein